jgi:hypothetical protein
MPSFKGKQKNIIAFLSIENFSLEYVGNTFHNVKRIWKRMLNHGIFLFIKEYYKIFSVSFQSRIMFICFR